jgi:hypothetical protein
MNNEWNLERVNQYIINKVEESLTLEYKAALALDQTDQKKKEIAKDVSSMANSAGGIIIYGICEYQEKSKRHLPEKIDPINRTQISKEWIEQVITQNIHPYIEELRIFPISINDENTLVCYVIDIPQSITAHQVTAIKDYRYYKRHNFESIPMEDYEIRLVMNRLVTPDVSVNFSYKIINRSQARHDYELTIYIDNPGPMIINKYKLEIIFPIVFIPEAPVSHYPEHISRTKDDNGNQIIAYHSTDVLFPNEEIDIGKEISLQYYIDDNIFARMRYDERKGKEATLSWKLYADNMSPKSGEIPIRALNNY